MEDARFVAPLKAGGQPSVLGVVGKVDPVGCVLSGHRHPLLHDPAVARVEALADAGRDELIDAGPRKLHDELIVDERPTGDFGRQLFLGENLDAGELTAEFRNGVLLLRIPVAETSKPRKVVIASRGGDSRTIKTGSAAPADAAETGLPEPAEAAQTASSEPAKA